MKKVKLHTNHGDIVARARRRERAGDGRELPAVRARRPLRQHDLPSRDRRLHDPGRRVRARDAAEAHARAGRARGHERAQEHEATRSRWRAPATRTRRRRSSSSTSATTRSSTSSRPAAKGWGYCVFGKVVEGADVVDKIKDVPTARSGHHENVPTTDVVILQGRGSRRLNWHARLDRLVACDRRSSSPTSISRPRGPRTPRRSTRGRAVPARGASAVYVLGDLFDSWLGDEQLAEPFAAGVAHVARAASRAPACRCT